jgi:hypothetical protein
MGQKDTSKAGLRFEGAMLNDHVVSNCVIHEGEGWGMSVKTAANVSVTDTYIVGAA